MSKATQRTVSFQTVGCRLNQYETEKMAAALYPFGFRRAARGEPVDLYIINTCTVTHRADSTNRYLIQKAARENPDARIVVAGCYVDSDVDRVAGLGPVDVVISNEEKPRIAEILSEQLSDLFEGEPVVVQTASPGAFERFNRAWLKISDGCNQRCSFCILPQVRGPLRNRPPVEIIAEIRELLALGFQEIVLTGVNIGHYKNRAVEPEVKNLAHLCRMILEQTELPRLRLSSIEPQTVREKLLRVCADSRGRICRHMHMPLQSGSSRLLRLMRRPYDRDTYLRRVTDARSAQPNTIVGADVIVGFPGETDDDFAQTVEMAESGLIDYLHVFSYSDRTGTAASKLVDKVSPEIIKERSACLSAVSDRLWAHAHARQVGETLGVIAEHVKPSRGMLYGIADNYINVKLPVNCAGGRRIQSVKVTSATTGYVEGEVISERDRAPGCHFR
jgi:threonylcarbamoyladenosine tRNA methylthiotransferase MtaB